jgi:hypothetical protein
MVMGMMLMRGMMMMMMMMMMMNHDDDDQETRLRWPRQSEPYPPLKSTFPPSLSSSCTGQPYRDDPPAGEGLGQDPMQSCPDSACGTIHTISTTSDDYGADDTDPMNHPPLTNRGDMTLAGEGLGQDPMQFCPDFAPLVDKYLEPHLRHREEKGLPTTEEFEAVSHSGQCDWVLHIMCSRR